MAKDTSELDTFYALSVTLTGFSLFDLRGTGVGEQYFSAAREHGREALPALLARYRDIAASSGRSEGTLEQRMRSVIMSDPTLGPLARNITKLWYLGSWALSDQDAPIVSPEAYQEGLVWKAIEAHPMGAKQPGWGTWAAPPGGELAHESDLVRK